METEIQKQVTTLLGDYGWLFFVGIIMLLFRSTVENVVAGLMVFIGNDYDEDDVIELDGKPQDRDWETTNHNRLTKL